VQRTPKITPGDYPDLLAAGEEGVSERELARRYRCARSLVHRHIARARHLRELEALQQETDLSARPIDGSLSEILDARMRDPKTPARDLVGLANARSRLNKEEGFGAGEQLALLFRYGTLILEPQRKSKPGPGRCRFRLLWSVPGGHQGSWGSVDGRGSPLPSPLRPRIRNRRPDAGDARLHPGRACSCRSAVRSERGEDRTRLAGVSDAIHSAIAVDASPAS
jgi:hypothetical protein